MIWNDYRDTGTLYSSDVMLLRRLYINDGFTLVSMVTGRSKLHDYVIQKCKGQMKG